jgi:hypothetical protein
MAHNNRQFAKEIARIPQPSKQTVHQGCSIRDFSSHHFQLFEGIEGPNVAEALLTNIEVLFDTLGCTNKQKVCYIGLKLVDLKECIAFRTSE